MNRRPDIGKYKARAAYIKTFLIAPNTNLVHLTKNCPVSKFVYSIFHLNQHQNFKIIASTPHNMGAFIGGRHKNFEDPMLF